MSCAVRAVADNAVSSSVALTKTPFYVAGAPNVVLETIKRSDDDDKHGTTSVILRLYETFGGHAKAKLHISDKIVVKKASLVNLLEDELEELKLTDGALDLSFRGFQFQTIKLVLDDSKSLE